MSASSFQRGVELFKAGRLADAENVLRDVLAKDFDAESAHLLGVVLQQQRHFDEALPLLQSAAQALPDRPEFHNNLASCLQSLGRLDEGEKSAREAIRLNPSYAIAHYNLGRIFRDWGRMDDALAEYETAIRIRPDYAKAHFSLSLILLQRGDWARGLDEYEWRWRRSDISTPQRPFAAPLWDGAPLPEKTLLLHSEQGLGDTINFIRYATLAAERCGRVIVETQPPLVRLVRTVSGVHDVIEMGQPLPPFDAHLPIVSLARVFKTRPESIPSQTPYMHASADAVEHWRDRLAPFEGKFKVGLTWSGNPQQERNAQRSMPLKILAPLATIPNVALFSLQKSRPPSDAADAIAMIDHTADLQDMADTAALMSNLDLIITTDTSVPHLAGALARPVWLMLSHDPDWRYLLDRDDTDWYPTMRLFRQQQAGQWNEVIARVAVELAVIVQQNT